MEGWIKLHRKIVESDVFFDDKSCKIFIWLLCMVNRKTGTIRLGRDWGANWLKMRSTTFYHALLRCHKKYHLIDIKSDNRGTVVNILKWNEYQESNNSYIDNKVTTNRQQSDNKVTLNKNKELRIKNREERDSLPKLKPSSYKIDMIANQYKVPASFVESKWDDLINYCKANNKTYTNYYYQLKRFVKDDALKIRKEHDDKRASKSKIAFIKTDE